MVSVLTSMRKYVTIKKLSVVLVLVFFMGLVITRAMGQAMPQPDAYYLTTASTFNTFSPIKVPVLQGDDMTVQRLDNIPIPAEWSQICHTGIQIETLNIAISRCGTIRKDLLIEVYQGAFPGAPIATFAVDESEVKSFDHLQPTWVSIPITRPLKVNPNLPTFFKVKVAQNISNVVGPIHIGPFPVLPHAPPTCTIDEYRWSVNSGNPWLTGNYLGNVAPAFAPMLSADAGLDAKIVPVTKLKVLYVTYNATIGISETLETKFKRLNGGEGIKDIGDELKRRLESGSGMQIEVEELPLGKFPDRRVCQLQTGNHGWFDWRPQTGSPRCVDTDIQHRYTAAEYMADAAAGDFWVPKPGSFNYLEMFHEITSTGDTVETRVNNHEIDEIWIWSDGTAGTWESTMYGPNAYDVNSIRAWSVPVPDLTRRVVVMGLSGEVPAENAIHSYAHRTEALIRRRIPSHAAHFMQLDHDVPGQGSVGTVHNPHNGRISPDDPSRWGSDHTNQVSALTDGDDWFLFPFLPNPANRMGKNCTAIFWGWGCTSAGYYDYWFDHIPKAGGVTGGVPNNWMRFIVHPDCMPQ